MTRQTAAVWMALVGLSLTGCGWWRTDKDIQRDYAKTLKPASLAGSETSPPSTGTPASIRTLRLRVYADDEHRSQTLKWDDRFRSQIERANLVLRPQFGVALEIESFRAWPRKHSSEDLQNALDELSTLDPAKDVDWVVGLVSSMSVFAASHDLIGMGRLFGRHFVLRSMESLGEVQHLERILKDLPVGERESLFHERRLHKETAVLLHEWAHTLGAFHERAWDALMSPVYQDYQSAFSDGSARLIRLGLDQRDKTADSDGRARWAKSWREVVGGFRNSPWTAEEGEHAGSVVAMMLEPSSASVSASAPKKPIELNHQDVARYNEAYALELQGDHDAALKALTPLIARYPGDARVQSFACGLSRQKSPGSTEALARCRAAMNLSAEPEDALVLANSLLETKDVPGALDALKEAEKRLSRKPGAAKTWVSLASMYRRASSPTLAETAAAHAPMLAEAASVLEWASSARRWAGLPPKATVDADREHEILLLMDEAREDLRNKRENRAQGRQKYLASKWKELPARHALGCQLAAANGNLQDVARACSEALSKWNELVYPHFMLGWVHSQLKNWRGAEDHLERTVELDPQWSEGWARLGGVYRARGRNAQLASLSARYKERFGEDLVPR